MRSARARRVVLVRKREGLAAEMWSGVASWARECSESGAERCQWVWLGEGCGLLRWMDGWVDGIPKTKEGRSVMGISTEFAFL